MRRHQILVLALTETRERQFVTTELAEGFNYCSTANNSGVGGVGFIVDKAKSAFTFSPVSERLATLRLTVSGLTLGLVVVYAPTEHASSRAKSRFFKAIRQQFQSLVRSCEHVVILEDFNCELGNDVEGTPAVRDAFAREAVSSENAIRVEEATCHRSNGKLVSLHHL